MSFLILLVNSDVQAHEMDPSAWELLLGDPGKKVLFEASVALN